MHGVTKYGMTIPKIMCMEKNIIIDDPLVEEKFPQVCVCVCVCAYTHTRPYTPTTAHSCTQKGLQFPVLAASDTGYVHTTPYDRKSTG